MSRSKRSRARKAERSRDRKRREAQRRKWYLRAGIAGVLGVIIAGALAVVLPWLGLGESELEKEFAAVIRYEDLLFEWEQRLAPQINEIADTAFKNNLNAPFEIARANRETNPYRHIALYDEKRKEGKVTQSPLRFLIEEGHSDTFFYDFLEDEKVGATFLPPIKLMLLHNSSHLNARDMLTLYHELHHVQQETDLWRHIKTEADLQRYHQALLDLNALEKGSGSLIIDELWAYAYQIEVLDLMMQGRLSEGVLRGEPLSTVIVMQELNARPNQYGATDLLNQFAGVYFLESGAKDGKFSDRYVRAVARHYRDDLGFRLLVETGEFQFKEISIEEVIQHVKKQ